MKYVRLKVPVSFFREGKRFVAYSPALELSTSGRTLDEVQHRFAEAVEIFFEEIEDLGTTEEVLRSLGWQRVQRSWVAPVPVKRPPPFAPETKSKWTRRREL